MIYQKICNKWKKFRLCPIHVYCLHHITSTYEESMNPCDWMALDDFCGKINRLREEGVTFISLRDAHHHLISDFLRLKKYAVLTIDDGYRSLINELLPWLEKQQIPATLFINGKYLDGISFRNNPNEHYLTKDELFALGSSLIEVGSHGWEHSDASKMDVEQFTHHINENVLLLKTHPRYIPFHAYTWGRYTMQTDEILHSKQITPVYVDGMKNYNESNIIHRELL